MIWFRAFLFLLLVPGVLLGLVPFRLLATGWAHAVSLDAARYFGAPLIAAGIALMFTCFTDFVRRGRGTPAPIDPPRRLVVTGPYRWVRNPMYFAGGLILLGEAILWEAPMLLAYLAAFWLWTHLFVVLYEERALVRRFGDEYRKYRAAVPRWIPRPPRSVVS